MKNDNLIFAGNGPDVLEQPKSASAEPQFEHAGNALPAQRSAAAKISIPVSEGLLMLNTDDIVTCLAHDSCTQIVLSCGTRHIVPRVLKDYEALLSEFNFFRIHNSCLINLKHVKKYLRGEGGSVIMNDGQSCEVSRRKKTGLLDRLSMVIL